MTSIAVLPSRMSSSYPEQRRTARPQIRHRPGFTHAPKLFHSRSLLHLYSSTLSSKKTAKSKSLTPIFSAALSHSFSLSITLKPVSPLLATLTKSTLGYAPPALPVFPFWKIARRTLRGRHFFSFDRCFSHALARTSQTVLPSRPYARLAFSSSGNVACNLSAASTLRARAFQEPV